MELAPPDLRDWEAGNCGIPYAWTFAASRPGPHVGLVALVHGNEFAGAHALLRLFELGVRPARGRLTLIFANVAALRRYRPEQPWAARFVEEDLNRLWSEEVLDAPRRSVELSRARELRPLIDRLDYLLDIHTMAAEGPPLLLCPPVARAQRLALSLGVPDYVVSCPGHGGGLRLVDYARFTRGRRGPVALLLEAGPHGCPRAADLALAVVLSLLSTLDMLAAEHAAWAAAPPRPQRLVDVTHRIDADGASLTLLVPQHSLIRVERAGTPVARLGERVIATPYDDCVLILPQRRSAPGTTALRMGRLRPQGRSRGFRFAAPDG